MNKLRATTKITTSTLKSFAKRNLGNIFSKTKSHFDGMTDCVQSVKDEFKPATIEEEGWGNLYKTGIKGIYTVGYSRDYFRLYEDSEFFGIEVSNSCGCSILAVKK